MKVSIIGRGNVGTHLHKALSFRKSADDTLVETAKNIRVSLLDSRTLEGLESDNDVILISVSDSAVKDVAERLADALPGYDGIVAHTSGSIPMSALSDIFEKAGVVYPMQTFTKSVEMEYGDIPFFIEGTDQNSASKLTELASQISDNVQSLDSEKRTRLHLASVFACNFANAMFDIADENLKDIGLDISVMLPLIRQTMAKIENISPKDAQTGPAKRKDMQIIEKHLNMLADKPELAEIYSNISKYLIER